MLLALLAAAEFALTAGAGTRGERRVEAVAHASSEDFGLSLGAASTQGPLAPSRQEVLAGVESGIWKGSLKVVPDAAGLTLLAGEAGVHFESISLVLDARTASLGRMQLRGAGVRVEVESEHAGVSASAWALQLQAPSGREPWSTWGDATLDWAQRWELSGWLSQDLLENFSVAPTLAFSQPAEAGFEARGGIDAELAVRSLKLRLSTSLARMWPQELWMLDLTLGVAMAFE